MFCRSTIRFPALSLGLFLTLGWLGCDAATPVHSGASGGSASSGGTATGGANSTGGQTASGGVAGTATTGATGGSGLSASGGRNTGGSVPGSGGATGGTIGSGGASPGTGGRATGGNGVPTGGSQNGGSTTGGNSSPTGGSTTGGSPTGGSGGSPRDASGGDVPVGPDATTGGPEPFTFGKAPAAAARFKKGINLGNRLEAPKEGDWGGTVLASDFPFIAKRGFDHVRIPIRFSGHAQASAPYTIDATFFARVDTVIDQALAAKLAVLVDMHAYDEMASNPASERARFLGLWSQIANRYKDRPDTVAFELLNEPNTQLDSQWNDIAAAAITTVRATNPRRLIVVDTVFWADPNKLASLVLPADANLLVAIHLYEPKLFSFQGKSWIGPEYMTTGVLFPGPPPSPITPVAAATAASWAKQWFDGYNTQPAATNPSGPATVTAQVAYLTTYMKAQGRAVYNGEWGPQDGGAMDARVRLVTEVRKQCEQAGVGWAIWEDTTNMKLFDSGAGTWVSQIVDALFQ